MAKHEREHALAEEFTAKFITMTKHAEFLDGYYKYRSSGYREEIELYLIPRLTRDIKIVFNPRAKNKWHLKFGNVDFYRFSSEDEVRAALEPENYISTGSVLGPKLMNLAEGMPVGEFYMTQMHASILKSYGQSARIWIANGYEEFRQSRNNAYYTCVGDYSHGLHDLNRCSLHFCYGIVSVSYHWNHNLWSSNNTFSVRGVKWPDTLIEAAPGQRVDQILDIPYVGDAIITRAYNFTDHVQISCKDEMKTLNEWIKDGAL